MTKFPLEIISPYRKVFAEDVDMVTVPTEDGTIGILAHHMQLFTALTEGEVVITVDDKKYFLAMFDGFLQVTKDKVLILVSRAVYGKEVNEAEIAKAIEAAKQVIKENVKGVELSQAQAMLRRSSLELRVLRKYRTHSHLNDPLSN
jgi:F-type H+-transporting ATPase subunit epsilon